MLSADHRRNFLFFASGVFLFLWATGLVLAENTKPVLSIVPDRPDAIYHQGEPATFTIRLEANGQPRDGVVRWIFLKNGSAEKIDGEISLKGGTATISGTLNEPGFLPVQVQCELDGKQLQAESAVAFNPLEIKPSLPVPDDFDAFWNEKKKALAAIPVNAVLTPVESTSPRVEVFDVKADCVGRPVSGFLARPVGAKPKSLPGILTLHGTGVLSSDLGQSIHWAGQGLLALDMNAHGLPNAQPNEFYTALAEGELKDYGFQGSRSRETYYFLGMYLRLIRAIDILTSQPEWDGRTLIVHGDSQGGQQALAAAGLDTRVSMLVAGVPAMCDPTGVLAGRIDGAFFVVSRNRAADGGVDREVVETLRYYSGANFASRVKATAQFVVGFVDHSCPPTLVYSAYNTLPGKKAIFNGPTAGHAPTIESREAVQQTILTHIKERREN